ncbi:hypothetical protein BB561_000842 [Smittium simulii]|uniref:DNA polymerase alpha subunit B n=1 Tax=Smittium simulii TaxID=133385 RepID=A0A2T9YXG6_9FUNG|nr:hypothetical protein BB561_000842 [Smittium simulii]
MSAKRITLSTIPWLDSFASFIALSASFLSLISTNYSKNAIKSQSAANSQYQDIKPFSDYKAPSAYPSDSFTDKSIIYTQKKSNNLVEFTLNSKPELPPNPQISVSLVPNTWSGKRKAELQNESAEYRYMVETLADRQEYLDYNLEYFADLSKVFYEIDSLANPRFMHQEDVYVVGRIVDGNLSSYFAENFTFNSKPPPKFDSSCVELATTKRLGSGSNIPLAIKSTSKFSLFPGQIVLAKGKNLTGNEFIVEEFLKLPRLPRPRFETSDFVTSVSGYKMFVASGPYTTVDNFKYLPLQDLAKEIIAKKPSVVVLMGPFVSAAQIQSHLLSLEMTPEDIFINVVSPILENIIRSCPSTELYLQPSLDDICFPYVVYPQPVPSETTKKELRIPSKAQFIPNPAQILINGKVCCFSSIDSILGLSATEINSGNYENSRLERLVSHMLEQRSFYPAENLNNVPLSYTILATESQKVCKLSEIKQVVGTDQNEKYIKQETIDTSKVYDTLDSNEDSFLNLDYETTPINLVYQPHVLVVASQLKPLAWNLYQDNSLPVSQNSVFINPGKLSIGVVGGTFAKVHVPPPSTSAIAHPKDDTFVEIVRL